MITKTEITGRTARTATGHINNGRRVKFELGGRVEITAWYDCGDGGDISTRAYGTIVRIGVGTEYGMRGTTAIAEVRWDGHGNTPAGTVSPVAVRNLEPSTLAVTRRAA